MRKKIWVFRLSLSSGGEPLSACPIQIAGQDLKHNVKKYREDFLPVWNEEDINDEYEHYSELTMDILKDELFIRGKLRQGWGMRFENMDTDLHQDPDNWVENFINLYWRLYEEKIDCSFACGRYEILKIMLDMNVGDIIFIPRIPYDNYFTITKIKKKYQFEPIKEFLGHGHSIEVENIKIFNYDEKRKPKIFNPYRKAISEVKKHHLNYSILKDFISKSYK